VVENRSGAGGSVGIDAVAKAVPDGFTLALGSTGAVAVNVSLNWLFMRWIGVSGIALSTTFVYIVSCGFLALMSWRLMKTCV